MNQAQLFSLLRDRKDRREYRQKDLLSPLLTGLRQIASGVAPLMLVCTTVYKEPFFTSTANQRRTVL